MKVLKERVVNGKTRLTIEISEGEKLIAIKPGRHYKLGYPVEDVMPSHVIQDPREVHWNCITQKWEDNL